MATAKKTITPKKIYTFQDEASLEKAIADWVALGKSKGIERTPSQFHRQAARLLIERDFSKGARKNL